MITFIAPTKNMKPQRASLPMSLPPFCVEAEELWQILKNWNDETIMNVMNVNAKMALHVQELLQHVRFDDNGSHALLTYSGLAFHAMKVSDWSDDDLRFAQQHLRILSGFYGMVRPLDSIYPYRLEMQAKDITERIGNLYTYWSDAMMQEMRQDCEDGIYINLASREYAQAVMPYFKDEERCINIEFRTVKNHTVKTIATHAKIARGKMVRMMMKQRINDPQSLKRFQEDGWQFHSESSDETHYVFLKYDEKSLK